MLHSIQTIQLRKQTQPSDTEQVTIRELSNLITLIVGRGVVRFFSFGGFVGSFILFEFFKRDLLFKKKIKALCPKSARQDFHHTRNEMYFQVSATGPQVSHNTAFSRGAKQRYAEGEG